MSRRWVRVAVVVTVGLVVLGIVWSRRPQEVDAKYCGSADLRHDLDALSVDQTPLRATAVLRAKVADAVAATETEGGALYVVAKTGKVWFVPTRTAAAEQVLDLAADIEAEELEQGLLGVAVAPDTRHLYLYGTFEGHHDSIVEYRLVDGRPDPASRRDVLVLDDPAATHNGGRIAFGPDGMLYLGIGDGGDGDTSGAAQNLGSPFGKLLRIDPTPDGTRPYEIPADNPFVDDAGARGEVWAYGLRNPWGWSLDAETGDLWVGDVGQICFEEIDRAADGGKGVNFGWSHEEGAHEFKGPAIGARGAPDESAELADLGPLPDDLHAPLVERRHEKGLVCSVIGGFVYRGSAFPSLDGSYLSSDLCGQQLETLTQSGDGWTSGRIEATPVPAGVVSIVPSRDGEILVISYPDGVYELQAATSGA